jgi:acetyltransferase-like isoleucine patch superfamily enzyme
MSIFVESKALDRVARARVVLRRNVWAHGGGRLTVGDRTRFECGSAGIELKVEKGAELALGDDVVIEGGTSIEAQRRIVIGDRCRIGRDCKLLDNHLHQVQGDRRLRPPSAPVVLESGVTLEDHVVVLPGAWLERGVHVGTGAVVSRRVAAGTRVEARPVHPSRHRETARPDEARRRRGFRDRPLASVGPWAERALGCLVARHALRGCEVGARVCVTGRLRVDRRCGRIVVGRGALFVGGLEPTFLVADDATLSIGDATVINYAVRLAAVGGDLVLGRRCYVGSNVRLFAEPGAPVVVGDDVWIAHGAVIEAGARIGSGSVVAAAAVVRGDVPPRSLAIGYPARSMSLDLAQGGQVAASDARRASSSWT